MSVKENGNFTVGHPADYFYHLMDETGQVYYNYIIICGEPWAHKEIRKHNAALYTYGEMLVAKAHFSRKRIRTYEKRVDKPGYRKRTQQEAKDFIKELQQKP
jgi:hypothetical protein